MAFRKRNVVLGRGASDTVAPDDGSHVTRPGVRPSSLTSHPLTSTGTPSLDSLLGGHGGLALGCSLLVEESGTTDFAGALLRYYAAEGICHGHVLHVVGVGDGWIRELPGVSEERSSNRKSTDEDKMKIAWRYENRGQAGERALSDRSISSAATVQEEPFCHTFDLTKRLSIPQDARIHHLQPSSSSAPFDSILQHLKQNLEAAPPTSIHRLVIPTILSPALYPPDACRPENFIRFLHSLRILLRQHPSKLTAMATLPLALHPRNSGLVRWAEILSDGVLELTPFPHLMDSVSENDTSASRGKEEQPQGLVRVHKLPINTERGEGGAGVGNSLGGDLAFTVTRRKFVIKPFSLPPMEGDQEAQAEAGKVTAKDVEF